MPSPIVLDLKPSPLALLVGVALILCAGFAVVLADLSLALRIGAVLLLCRVGCAELRSLLYGHSVHALSQLQWLGDDRWLLRDSGGRCARARLARSSRRFGGATLLVFRRGVFTRCDRPWVLVFPNMVTDASAARRLRARLGVDGARMRGMEVT